MTPAFSDFAGNEIVAIRADSLEALVAEMKRIIAFIDRMPDASLLDIAYTCSLQEGACVIAMIANDVSSLRARLFSAVTRLEPGGVKRLKDKSGTYYFAEHLLGEGGGKLAFVYPSVMSFYPDMMRDLAILHPSCRSAFDELEEAVIGEDEAFTPSNFIFPPASYYRQDADVFRSGAYAQALVATYAASAAMTRLLSSGGLKPDGVVGFGGGDLAAAMRSGVVGEKVSRPDRIQYIRDIYRIVAKAVNHGGLPKVAMISIVMRHEGQADPVVATFPPKKVMLALDLSPRQRSYVVLPEFEEEAMKAFAVAGIRAVKMALDRPFNTPLCASVVPAIKRFTSDWVKHETKCDVYSCAEAEKLAKKPRATKTDTAERWAKPVRFTETVRRMYNDGYRVFLEVGPRGLMTSAISDILGGEEYAAIAMNSIHRRGRLQLQHAIAQLLAHGAVFSITTLFARRGARKLDFDSMIPTEVREAVEMPLSRLFPRLSLLGDTKKMVGAEFLAEPKGRGAKAAQRAAVLADKKRRQQQFDFGVAFPLISDADELESEPGVSYEISKVFTLDATPFVADAAYGASQLSYSDPALKGLVILSIPVAAEIMAETAMRVMPNRMVVAIEDFSCRRLVQFKKGRLKLFIRAERVASADVNHAAIKVQVRDDAPNAAYTWPVMEATFILAAEMPEASPSQVEPMRKPRSIHWSERDIYPNKLGFGRRLRGITFAETWGEGGLDYEVEVPPLADAVAFTRFPLWAINPLLMQVVVSGFMLWRSTERFSGAFSYPFRMHRLDLKGGLPQEGTRLNCYLRLVDATEKSQLCDITVTSGDGNVVMEIDGWEEITERGAPALCELILQPATTFVTEKMNDELLGYPVANVASAFITDVPYAQFERNEELWLKIVSHVVLNSLELKEFLEMKGSASRRTEWLYGRIAAKEAVRRYLKEYHHARWSYADVQIWRNESGKPIAIGDWSRYLTAKLDVAIAHTAQFVVAVAVSNKRVGVDVESITRDLSAEFTNGVFLADEQELAAKALNPSQALIRFWCAKEAVSKALGTGIRFSPREMIIADYQAEEGTILVRLEGAWADAFKRLRGVDIPVTTRIVRDHALAFCFISPSWLQDEDA